MSAGIISAYVREQKRYTKKEIKKLFALSDTNEEKFIKNLKAFGILKCVNNNSEQLEMSDLIDEDIQIVDDTITDDCLYVFTYVGIAICGNRILKIYPKYILNNTEPLIEMKKVLKVIEKYNRTEPQTIHLYNGDDENKTFNTLAVILFLINDYYENGLYTNTEEIIEINGEGDILWGRTIDESFSMIKNNRPYYMELITRKTVDDDFDYFKRLHACVITECSKLLNDAQIDSLFDMDQLLLSEETIRDFGDVDYILYKLNQEINIQYNTRKQILLKTIYAYISQEKKLLDMESGLTLYGTSSFHVIWEKVCAEVFDNKLKTELRNLKMSVPLAEEYQDLKNIQLGKIIEKPIWQDDDTIKEANETLEPDIISINRVGDVEYFIIFDAKYYNLQLEKNRPLRGNPGIADVTKQYLYQLAYKKFIEAHNIAVIKNCFLMPTDKDVIIKKGMARLPMLEALKLENIQIRLLPANTIYDYYLSQNTMDIGVLEL